MPRLPDGQISKHPTHGYRLTLGKYLREGKPTPRLFWLGHDLERAQYLVFTWKKAYMQLRGSGQEYWTEEAITSVRDFLAFGEGMTQDAINRLRQNIENDRNRITFLQENAVPIAIQGQKAAPTRTEQTSDSEEFTLRKAIAQYTQYLQNKVPNQLSRTNCSRQIASLKCIDEVLPGETLISDVGKRQLETLVAYFTARPVREQTGNPLAADTVLTILKHARMFFDWLDGDSWSGPRRWEKVFKIRRNNLMTPAEQRADANGKEVFSLAELKLLYSNANERQRLYMLLALNCAFTQKDLATLALADLQLDADPAVIDRIRHKTRGAGIRGRWALWPETCELLRKRIRQTPANAATNPQQLAMLTEDGRPLVNDENDTDSVGLTWRRLLRGINKNAATIRPLPFKTLRKTAADLILRLSTSESVQQLMLSHSRRSVAARHYSGEHDFAPLVEPLHRLYLHLKEAGVFTAAQPTDHRCVVAHPLLTGGAAA
jgi:integrase